MKEWVVKIVITLLVFLCFSFFVPVLVTSVEKWPEWIRSPQVQFLFNLIVAFIFGFNPGTTLLIKNSLKINGNENDVKQERRSSVTGQSGMNTAKIKGNKNKINQG